VGPEGDEAAAPKPPTPPSRVKVTQAEPPLHDAADWDDEEGLSPELAGILFGAPQPKPAAPASLVPPGEEVTRRDQPPRTEKEPESATAAEPEPAASIMLTDVADSRHLRLTAGDHSAAAPDAPLSGKGRYTRIEEPLSGDQGQRTVETWAYFKPDFPSLDGRLVRATRSKEIAYADGSWEWHYERRYSDGGRDRRIVRANQDRAYIERHDEVSKRDPATGKRVMYREDTALILAAPAREEKRGLLGSLIGRDDAPGGGKKAWRAATSSESRQARKQGDQVFRRRWFF
jgi:hypothetical protein